MADDTRFEARLAVALARYAELAPVMDDETVAHAAIEAGRHRWAPRWTAVRGPVGDLRLVHVAVLVALLLAAALLLVAGGSWFRGRPPLGANGTIVYSFGGNGHAAVAATALGPGGGDGRPIAAGRCPTWSRQGNVLAWVDYDGQAELVVARPDGTPTERFQLAAAAEQSVTFAVSPDGGRVAWLRPAQPGDPALELWVASFDGGPGARIVPASGTPGESYGAPLWSPDGQRIAFGAYVTNRATGERLRTAIDVVAADGSRRTRLTTRPGLLDDGMSWSPDGVRLVYAGLPDGSTLSTAADGPGLGVHARDLFVIGGDGSGERRLTDTPISEHHPDWSPDGGFLAFEASAEGEADRVTTLQVDGGGSTGPPRPGPASDWFVWAPDGRLLLWQELSSVGQERFRTTVHAVDREFRQPSTTLQIVDGLIVCPPSWQRLEP